MGQRFRHPWIAHFGESDAADAWRVFAELHFPLILAIARQATAQPDDAEDCFLFVCERLCERDFRRLDAWRPRAGVGFEAWLRTVTARLCIDWRRTQHGRHRPPSAVARMGELQQRVFELRFDRHLTITECYETLRPDFPDLTEVELARVVGELNAGLSSRQHWQLKMRQRGFVSLDEPTSEWRVAEEAPQSPSAEREAARAERHARVQGAMAKLPAQDRLLLRLRYEQDLSFREIAEIAGLADLQQARYRIDKALARLQELLAD